MRSRSRLLLLAVATVALVACSDSQKPLTDLERAIWATDVPDVIPRPPAIQALAGKPGHPDYERPRAKGRTVLRYVPTGATAPVASAALASRGFAITLDPPSGDPVVQWMSAEKTWCATFKCCVTNVAVQLTAGRVSGAMAYDYEYGRWLRMPVVQNAMFGPARCARSPREETNLASSSG